MTQINSAASIEWATAVKREHTPLFLSLLVAGQEGSRLKTVTGLPITLTNIRRRNDALQYDKQQLSNARAYIRSRWREEGTAFFESFAVRCMNSCNATLDTARSIRRQAVKNQKLSSGAIKGYLERYFDSVSSHASFLQTVILVQFELEDYLRQFVERRCQTAQMKDHDLISGQLKIALEPTHEVQNGTQLLELGAFVQSQVANYRAWIDSDPIDLTTQIARQYVELWDRIQSYVNKFGWMGRMYYVGPRLSAIATVMRLQNILRSECASKLAHVANKRQVELAAREDAIGKLAGDEESRRLAAVVSTYMHLRSYRLDIFFIAHDEMLPLWNACVEQLPLSQLDDLPFLTYEKILDELGGEQDSRHLASTIGARRRGFEFLATEGQDLHWLTKTAPNREGGAGGNESGRSVELNGTSAWPGRVRGRVRIVRQESDVINMEAGEILVATMTMPSLMLGVEKAAAIVTDEGGMLCHAAIVSREFDIPCVIGTGSATSSYRTGDLVDVDADAGVIRTVEG